MSNKIPFLPAISNTAVLNYKPGSTEKAEVLNEIQRLKSQKIEVPMIINGKEVMTRSTGRLAAPHEHRFKLGSFAKGTAEHACLLYTSPSPRDQRGSRMPSSA